MCFNNMLTYKSGLAGTYKSGLAGIIIWYVFK